MNDGLLRGCKAGTLVTAFVLALNAATSLFTTSAEGIQFSTADSLRVQDSPATSQGRQMDQFVEIRSYNLKPGARGTFHRLFVREALPMLQRWKVDVVAYGPSPHDSDSYYLVRGYSSPDQRQRSQDAFYGSNEWKQGPREAILGLIENYTTISIWLDEPTVRGLREAGRRQLARAAEAARAQDLERISIE
jgi:hypothetical protein